MCNVFMGLFKNHAWNFRALYLLLVKTTSGRVSSYLWVSFEILLNDYVHRSEILSGSLHQKSMPINFFPPTFAIDSLLQKLPLYNKLITESQI